MKTKGQMEMIGLVVIVILITLGMIVVMVGMKDQPQKKIFTRKGLAYSTMSSLMKTTVSGYRFATSGCLEKSGTGSLQMGKDILEKCALNYDLQKDPFSQCQEVHSCQFLNATITSLLNATLKQWGKGYELRSVLITSYSSDPEILLAINPGKCSKKERDTSGPFPIQTEAGLVESQLYICD